MNYAHRQELEKLSAKRRRQGRLNKADMERYWQLIEMEAKEDD